MVPKAGNRHSDKIRRKTEGGTPAAARSLSVYADARRPGAFDGSRYPLFGLLVVVALLTPTVSPAQAPPKSNPPIAPKSQQLDPDACGNSNRATVGQGGEMQTKKPDGRDLSDQLAQSNGVICPPPLIDPAIKAPTPQEGSMPVIPPPGSPGGNPNVQPK